MCTQTDRGRGRARDSECIVAGDCRQIAEPLLTSALRFPAFLCARGAPILPREISHGLAEQMARDANNGEATLLGRLVGIVGLYAE